MNKRGVAWGVPKKAPWIKNKRGSHIGVIVSFLVFIGMIIFLYAILAPVISRGQSYQSIEDSLKSSLETNISGNVTMISFYVNAGSGCMLLSGFVPAAGLTSLSNFVVSDISGTRSYLNISNSNSNDVYFTKGTSSPELLNAYDSSYFDQTLSGTPGSSCTTLINGTGSGTYRIGQVKTETYALEILILKLMKSYNESYQAVKSSFEVPAGFGFGFNFTYQNGTVIGTAENTQGSSNIYSQSYPLTYITLNGSMEQGKLIVNLWQ